MIRVLAPCTKRRAIIARRSDIPPEAAPLIDLLAEERLLSRDTRVTHDPKTGEEILVFSLADSQGFRETRKK